MVKSKAYEIFSRISNMGKGSVFTPKDFLDIANHETVRQVLCRLNRDGKIRRLSHGLYEFPTYSKLLKAPAAPESNAIAHAIARAHGWTITPTGSTALNLLGLSTQVPAQWQYFSDGPYKTYQQDGRTLIFKHRTNKETTSLSQKTALLVQALKALGENNIDDKVLMILRSKLDEKDFARAAKEARYVTAWVYEVIKRLALKENNHA